MTSAGPAAVASRARGTRHDLLRDAATAAPDGKDARVR
jgi:hypothetical protein